MGELGGEGYWGPGDFQFQPDCFPLQLGFFLCFIHFSDILMVTGLGFVQVDDMFVNI